MDKLTQSNYERFNKLFHKGEQIVVGFREDFTHGYLTKIDETGFGLFQLNKPKEYWYDWEHFEFASHPSFRFKKYPELKEEWIDKVNTFTIKLLGDSFPDASRIDDIPIKYTFHNSEDVIACINRFNLKPSELASFDGNAPWGHLEVKINNGKARISGKNGFTQSLPDLGGDFEIIKIYVFGEDWTVPNLSFEGNGLLTKKVHDNKELDIMRITKLGSAPRYVSTGDPWVTDEPVEEVGFNIWKSKDGYAMSHAKAIIVEVICR
uniref:Uncharacterized protein n=1 Tax=viral metagenome TaxID=1070528 RepID=A0A6M3L0B0_9ZZZZ